MSLVDIHGCQLTGARYGEQVEGFELPDGAIVSKAISFDLHKRIQNDTGLRERLEAAQRQTGRKILHLSLLDHGNQYITVDVEKAIEANLDFGEKIVRSRIETEKLTETGKAYANIKNVA